MEQSNTIIERVLITAALPYANGDLHLGHISGCYLGADVRARFERLCGKDVLFVSGSDCYGVAVKLAAEKLGKHPADLVAHFNKEHRLILERLKISCDIFSSTQNAFHNDTVQNMFNTLLDKGYIKSWFSEMLFSEERQSFIADRYVKGICPKCSFDNARGDECPRCGAYYQAEELYNPRDIIGDSPLRMKSSKHWFLMINDMQDLLYDLIIGSNWKQKHVNFALNFLEDSEPRCISRDLDWGVPLNIPGGEGKVFYVWFDALLGYISITREIMSLRGDANGVERFWKDKNTHYIAFMGKDNLAFHTVIFPAILSAADASYKMIDEVVANDFYLLEGKQFSKSDGWFVSVDEALSVMPVDTLRFYLALSAPENGDASFSWSVLIDEVNASLVGNIGNFINRVNVLWHRGFTGDRVACSYDDGFIHKVDDVLGEVAEAYSRSNLRNVTELLKELGDIGNKYFSSNEVWNLIKTDVEQGKQILMNCFYCIDKIALAMAPLMPEISEILARHLGRSTEDTCSWSIWAKAMIDSCNISEIRDVLFRKIEHNDIRTIKERMQASVSQ